MLVMSYWIKPIIELSTDFLANKNSFIESSCLCPDTLMIRIINHVSLAHRFVILVNYITINVPNVLLDKTEN